MCWIERSKRGSKKRDGWGEWDGAGTELSGKLVEASLPIRRSSGSSPGTRDEPLKTAPACGVEGYLAGLDACLIESSRNDYEKEIFPIVILNTTSVNQRHFGGKMW